MLLTRTRRHVVIRRQFVEFQGWSIRYDGDTTTPGDSASSGANRFLDARLLDTDAAATRCKYKNFSLNSWSINTFCFPISANFFYILLLE